MSGVRIEQAYGRRRSLKDIHEIVMYTNVLSSGKPYGVTVRILNEVEND